MTDKKGGGDLGSGGGRERGKEGGRLADDGQ